MKLSNDKSIEDDKGYEDQVDEIDNKLELLKYMTKVISRGIKKDITPDFVMAKFNKEKDKEGIIEMTNNAYFCKRTLDMMTKKNVWEYNYKNKSWILRKQTENERNEIIKITDKMFDTFMTRMSMTAILNRNVDKNHILRLMAGLDTNDLEQIQQQTQKQETSRIEALWNKVKGKKEETEE